MSKRFNFRETHGTANAADFTLTSPQGSGRSYQSHFYPHFNRLEPKRHQRLRELLVRPSVDPDLDALNVFLRIETFVGTDTAFRHIKADPPDYQWAASITPCDLDYEQIIDGYVDLFRTSIRRCLDTGKVAFPLSGGQDSRHILLELCQQKQKPSFCWTVDIPWRPSEANLAAFLCKRLNLPHRRFELHTDLIGIESQKLNATDFSGRLTPSGAASYEPARGKELKVRGEHGLAVRLSADSARIGESITLTANKSVTWSLAERSLGSLEVIDGTHARYTAPGSGIPIAASIGGCSVGPNDSIFASPVANLPVHPQSQNWLSRMTGYRLLAEPSFGYSIVTGKPVFYKAKFFYGGGGLFPLTSWPNKWREGGVFNSRSDNRDHHEFTVLTGTNPCQFFETYNAQLNPTHTYNCQNDFPGCTGGSGDVFTPSTYSIYAGTAAAGLPQWLVLRIDEIKNNAIHHPTRFTMARGFVQGPAGGTPNLWPASGRNGWGRLTLCRMVPVCRCTRPWMSRNTRNTPATF